jgi:hypothetical protein
MIMGNATNMDGLPVDALQAQTLQPHDAAAAPRSRRASLGMHVDGADIAAALEQADSKTTQRQRGSLAFRGGSVFATVMNNPDENPMLLLELCHVLGVLAFMRGEPVPARRRLEEVMLVYKTKRLDFEKLRSFQYDSQFDPGVSGQGTQVLAMFQLGQFRAAFEALTDDHDITAIAKKVMHLPSTRRLWFCGCVTYLLLGLPGLMRTEGLALMRLPHNQKIVLDAQMEEEQELASMKEDALGILLASPETQAGHSSAPSQGTEERKKGFLAMSAQEQAEYFLSGAGGGVLPGSTKQGGEFMPSDVSFEVLQTLVSDWAVCEEEYVKRLSVRNHLFGTSTYGNKRGSARVHKLGGDEASCYFVHDMDLYEFSLPFEVLQLQQYQAIAKRVGDLARELLHEATFGSPVLLLAVCRVLELTDQHNLGIRLTTLWIDWARDGPRGFPRCFFSDALRMRANFKIARWLRMWGDIMQSRDYLSASNFVVALVTPRLLSTAESPEQKEVDEACPFAKGGVTKMIGPECTANITHVLACKLGSATGCVTQTTTTSEEQRGQEQGQAQDHHQRWKDIDEQMHVALGKLQAAESQKRTLAELFARSAVMKPALVALMANLGFVLSSAMDDLQDGLGVAKAQQADGLLLRVLRTIGLLSLMVVKCPFLQNDENSRMYFEDLRALVEQVDSRSAAHDVSMSQNSNTSVDDQSMSQLLEESAVHSKYETCGDILEARLVLSTFDVISFVKYSR